MVRGRRRACRSNGAAVGEAPMSVSAAFFHAQAEVRGDERGRTCEIDAHKTGEVQVIT